VADRISTDRGGYRYEIQFSVSGLESRSVAFESSHAALTVSVRDVDHNSTLDIVVSEAVSRQVTNVLLNDGRGRFRPSAPPPAGNSAGARRVLDESDAVATGAIAVGDDFGKLAIGLDACGRVAQVPGERSLGLEPSSRSIAPSSSLASRAPPRNR